MVYVNLRRSDLAVSRAVKLTRNPFRRSWVIRATAMLSISCFTQQTPVRPYDKLCEAQVGLVGNATTYAYIHPGTGLKETPDLISGLQQQEQTLVHKACGEWGKSLIKEATALQIWEQSGGKYRVGGPQSK
jgi:hypothetical protein